MKTGTQEKASNQVSMGETDSNCNLSADKIASAKSSGGKSNNNDAEDNVSPSSVENNVHNNTSKLSDSPDPSREDTMQIDVVDGDLTDAVNNTDNGESSSGPDKVIRRSGRKISSNIRVVSSSDSDVPVLLVDSHSKLPLVSNVTTIAKNKPMAIKVVGKSELSTQDLVAKAKKMLTFLTRSKSGKKTIAQNSKPIKKIVTSAPVNVKKIQLTTSRGQRLKEDIMKELIASTPSGFSVTRTYSGLRDKLKESKDSDASSSNTTTSSSASTAKLISTSVPNLPSSVAKSSSSSTSTSIAGCTDDISTIELFDDGLKPMTTSDTPSVNQSSYDLLSKNRCAISICKHMSGECNLASRTSESSDGRAWYNFLRVADPAHYTSPSCPMKQIFLCFCHFSPEYVVYAPRLRSHSIPTISLPRHLNQNSTVKNKSDRIKDERLLHKKLQDAETKVRELEYKVKNMNSILSKFSQDELRKIQGRAVKWSKGTLEKALSVRALVGPSAYEHISKLFPLPSLRVLNNLPDEFLKELNVDRLSFPSKNKGKNKDRLKTNQEKEAGKKRKPAGGSSKSQLSSQVASTSSESRNELDQAIETINSQAVTATCTIPRTHLDEFASHALLDISHMYPSNASMGSLTLSTLTPESTSIQMSQAFAEIDFSSFTSSSPMPFNASVLSTPQATSVQTIHVTSLPSSVATCTVTPASATFTKDTSAASSSEAPSVESENGTKIRQNSSSSTGKTMSNNRKSKLVITPRFGRNAPKAASVTGKMHTTSDDTTSTINLPDGNQLDLNNSINIDINLPPFESSSSSSTATTASTSHRITTYSERPKSKTVTKSPRSTTCTSDTLSKTVSPSTASRTTLDNGESAAKKSKSETPVKFELVETENLSSKERITVFNVLTEIHVKFKAQYHRCSTCCLFLHGDALNQFMRMVETNIVKYSPYLSDLASTSVKTFQDEMFDFVKKLKPDIFPKCPLYNEHLRFLIVEYISASINCKRSKLSTGSVTSLNQPTGTSNTISSVNSTSSNSRSTISTVRNASKGLIRKSSSSTPSSVSCQVKDIVTHTITSSDGDTVKCDANDAAKKLSNNSASQSSEHLSTSSSPVTATLVN